MRRCFVCKHIIWPWQKYGWVVLNFVPRPFVSGRVYWHRWCLDHE